MLTGRRKQRSINKPDDSPRERLNEKQALVWSLAWVIPVLFLAYQLQGGTDYLHVEALGGLLAIDGLLLLIIAFSPRSNNSLFSRVRNNHRDVDIITILIFLSTLLLINGLFDLVPSEGGSGLIAGIGTTAGEGVATLVGVFLLLVAMFAILMFMVVECLAGTPKNNDDHASGVATSEAAAPPSSHFVPVTYPSQGLVQFEITPMGH